MTKYHINLAKLFSFALGPLWAPVLFVVLSENFFYGIPANFLLVILIIQVTIPMGFFFVLPVTQNKSWDTPNLKERVKTIFVMMVCTLIILLLGVRSGYSQVVDFNIMLLLLLLPLMVISKFWKVSFHAYANSGSVILINYLYNWKFPFLLAVIPTVIWSRLVLKRHTPMQLAVGTILPAGILYLLFNSPLFK